jgi:hypothetical protein
MTKRTSTVADAHCDKCGKKLRRDNRTGRCAACRTYSRLTPYGKQANCARSRKNHAEFRVKIAAIKVERGCVDCGYNGHPAALDFDHLPGAVKVKSVSLMWGYAWDKVLAEIAKCEVVCSNCHRIRTAERRAGEADAAPSAPTFTPRVLPPAACGTASGYNRHRRQGETPCAECKAAAAADRNRTYQARHAERIAKQERAREAGTLW